jgi:hydrogenase expression/formation protein HypC
MCLAIPGKVVELLPGSGDQLAMVDVAGAKRPINVGLLDGEPLAPGDWVLIHVGFAMSTVDEQEAAEALRMLELIGQATEEEVFPMEEQEQGGRLSEEPQSERGPMGSRDKGGPPGAGPADRPAATADADSDSGVDPQEPAAEGAPTMPTGDQGG